MAKVWSKKEKVAYSFAFVMLAGLLAFSSFVTAAAFVDKESESGFKGTVGLRSYFQKGTGTKADPFVIARPRHLHNLSKLQSLGALKTKLYFSLGYDADTTDADDTLKFFESDSSNNQIAYLDMSDTSTSPLYSIGNEAKPFLGIFEGNNLEIKNLTVNSGPQDIGVFGYTYTGSAVQNVFFTNLNIVSNGYDPTISDLDALYSTSMSDLGSLSYMNSSLEQAVSLTTAAPSPLLTDPNLDGYFLSTFPATKPANDVSFYYISSSEYLKVNSDYTRATIDYTALTDTTNTDFVGVDGAVLSCRLSLVASLFRDSVTYTRILSTYRVNFKNTIVNSASTITISAQLDYVEENNTSGITNYAHGVNVGYLIGHCDGSASSCYVYNGTIKTNQNSAFQTFVQESETGLIGEVGPAIKNDYLPKPSDTGVLNFTHIYDDVMGTQDAVSATNPFTGGTYYTFTPAAGTSDKYAPLLRQTYVTGDEKRITSGTNNVDFIGQTVVKDEPGYNRGLGVFSLITCNNYTQSESSYYGGLGDFAITKGSSFTKFYYTTAEFNGSYLDSTGARQRLPFL